MEEIETKQKRQQSRNMVQYVFTPWKDRGELLQVRRQFFPQQVAQHAPTVASGNGAVAAAGTAASSSFSSSSIVSSSSSSRADKKSAVSRVSMWMQRGGCPHMVESTALLIAAMIADEESMLLPTGKSATDSNSSYAVRASYSAAFSRCVAMLDVFFVFVLFLALRHTHPPPYPHSPFFISPGASSFFFFFFFVRHCCLVAGWFILLDPSACFLPTYTHCINHSSPSAYVFF